MPYSDLYCLRCHVRMELRYVDNKPALWVCPRCGRKRTYVTWSERIMEVMLAAILVIGGLLIFILKFILGYF